MDFETLVDTIVERLMEDRKAARVRLRGSVRRHAPGLHDLLERLIGDQNQTSEQRKTEERLVRARIMRILRYARDAGVPIPAEP